MLFKLTDYPTQKFNKTKAKIISTFIGSAVFLLVALFVYNEDKRLKEKEYLEVTKSYVEYQSAIENLIQDNISLLKGYLAFLNIEGSFDQKKSENYLERLLGADRGIIRNIGVIQDTTMIWNYPYSENESVIGKDLATIEGQKEAVLETKNKHIAVFQGPLNLIQGGIGFVTRIPIIQDNGAYWGQVSIVLDGDQFIQKATELGNQYGLQVALFDKNDYPKSPFVGDLSITESYYLKFPMKMNYVEWIIAVAPEQGWSVNYMRIFLALAGGLMFAVLLAIMTYYAIYSNFKLRYQAVHDSLTGILNRSFLDEYRGLIFSRAERTQTKVGIMLIDLCQFKVINDTFGHKMGDQVLVCTAKQLKQVCRSTEAVFRLGGDEFLVIFPDIDHPSDMEIIKNRVKSSFNRRYVFDQHKINIIPNIGYASYPDESEDFEVLLHLADQRMYDDKELTRK